MFNFLNKILSTAEKRILLLGLYFGLPTRKLNFNKYYLIFEELFLQLQNFNIYRCILNSQQAFRALLKTIAHKHFNDLKPMNDLFYIYKIRLFYFKDYLVTRISI